MAGRAEPIYAGLVEAARQSAVNGVDETRLENKGAARLMDRVRGIAPGGDGCLPVLQTALT